MKEFLTIFKLLATYRFKSHKKTKSIIIGGILLGLYLLFLMVSACSFIVALSPTLVANQIVPEAISLLFSLATVVILLIGIASLVSVLFLSKDNKFFLALPISTRKLFLAKFFVVYINQLVFVVGVLLPMIITLGICCDMGVIYYIVMIPASIIMPALGMCIASIIAIPISMLISLVKHRGILTTVLAIAVFVVGFYLYYQLVISVSHSLGSGELENGYGYAVYLASSLGKIVFPFYYLGNLACLVGVFGQGAILSSLISFGLSYGILIALLFACILVAGAWYSRTLKAGQESSSTVKVKKDNLKETQSVEKALLSKEAKVMLRSPTFAINCILGTVLTPILIGAASFYVNVVMKSGAVDNLFFCIILCSLFYFITYFGCCLNMTGTTSLVREGKNYMLMKSLPVSYKSQVKAKLKLANIIAYVGIILSCALSIIIVKNIIAVIFMTIPILMLAYGLNCLSVRLGLNKPKLNWETENEAVKSNFGLILPMLLQMGISAVVTVVYVFGVVLAYILCESFVVASIVGGIVAIIPSLILCLVAHKLLYGSINRKMSELQLNE